MPDHIDLDSTYRKVLEVLEKVYIVIDFVTAILKAIFVHSRHIVAKNKARDRFDDLWYVNDLKCPVVIFSALSVAVLKRIDGNLINDKAGDETEIIN